MSLSEASCKQRLHSRRTDESDSLWRPWLSCTPSGGIQPTVHAPYGTRLFIIRSLELARGLHFTEPEVLEVHMNRTVQTFKSAMPSLALVAVLMLLGPAAALAQRGGGGHGGHSGGSFSGRSFSGGGGRGYSAPSYSGRGYSGGRSYAAPSYSGRSYSGGGRSYAAPSYSGRGYSGGRSNYGGGYYPGRFYAGRGYYYGGRFWSRPYFGVGIGIPFGWGYDLGYGCGYYDGYGNWQPAPCYSNLYPGY